nr:hypothetical protein BgiMline_009278 [Biomphalaria glabrata]
MRQLRSQRSSPGGISVSCYVKTCRIDCQVEQNGPKSGHYSPGLPGQKVTAQAETVAYQRMLSSRRITQGPDSMLYINFTGDKHKVLTQCFTSTSQATNKRSRLNALHQLHRRQTQGPDSMLYIDFTDDKHKVLTQCFTSTSQATNTRS